jgi:SAM-dependent methyltransferase
MPAAQLEQTTDAVWLDVEYAAYAADLEYWLELARRAGGTVVDVGAGVGRVSIALAEAGHDVIAVDIDPSSIEELRARARDLDLVFDAAVQDARDLWLPRHVPLIIVPCSTIQMLGERRDRGRFIERAAHWLEPGGTLAVALHADAEPWEAARDGLPAADVLHGEHEYVSQPVALRRTRDCMLLVCERSVDGGAPVRHVDRLWRVTPRMLAAEAARYGLVVAGARLMSDGVRDDVVFVALRKR